MPLYRKNSYYLRILDVTTDVTRFLRILHTVMSDCAYAQNEIIHQPQTPIEIKLTLGDLWSICLNNS